MFINAWQYETGIVNNNNNNNTSRAKGSEKLTNQKRFIFSLVVMVAIIAVYAYANPVECTLQAEPSFEP